MALAESNRGGTFSGGRTASGADAARADGGSTTASAMLAELAEKPVTAWLAAGRRLALEHDFAGAGVVFRAALARHPDEAELCLALAGVRWQLHDHAGARTLLEALLEREPDHLAAAFTLARLQIEQGQVQAAEGVLCQLFGHHREPPESVLRAAKLLANAGDKPGAATLCEAAIAAGSGDPFVRLYAAALQGQLGNFEHSREHYLFALEHDPRTVEAGAAYGLASIKRYRDPADPDLAWFRTLLAQPGLTRAARASVLFALGKASDDLAEYADAAEYLRAANGLVDHRAWSRKNWRRMVEAKLAGTRLPQRAPPAAECVPIFIVGVPRSGTTLVAELLGRSQQVCNRGELNWLPHYADLVARANRPDTDLLDKIAVDYLAKLQRGATETRWFIDKQPLNFLHTDLIRALFPQARIIHCRRSPRDTALSIWSQHFESTEYRFAYDFADIAAVLTACERLMAKARLDAHLLEVRYEELARDPQAVIDGLAVRLGMAGFDCSVPNARGGAIGTASVWQARQPVYTRAIGRWRAYADFVPELLNFADR